MPTRGLRSPERAPSTWKTRFGKKPSDSDGHPKRRGRSSSPPPPQSITDQLLSALDARDKRLEPEEELSRQCADELLGRRNAFVPDIRMPDHEPRSQYLARESYDNDNDDDDDDDDERSAAHEIVKNRFQIELRADTIREDERRKENESHVLGADASPRAWGLDQNRSSDQEAHEIAVVDPIKQMEQRQERIREMKAARAVAAGSNQPQFEEEDGTGRSASDTKLPQPTRSGSNQESTSSTPDDGRAKLSVPTGSATLAARREERLLHERIRRLANENQQAAQLEDRARHQRQQRQVAASAFSLWRKLVDERRRQAARARQVFAWRLLLRAWGGWKRWTRAMATERAEQETRAALVREKLVRARAEKHWREKQLPRWFFRWSASVRAAKEAREFDAAQQRRKEQAQRLMERMLRQQAVPEEEEKPSRSRRYDERCEAPTDARAADAKPGEHARHRHCHAGGVPAGASLLVSSRKAPDAHTIEPDAEELALAVSPTQSCPATSSPHGYPPPAPPKTASVASKTSKSCPPPAIDPLYASMQERAAERKQRRDLLKQRYEQLEQEKRDCAAMQMAEVEAQIAQQKLDERARVRERKRQEVLAAQEKAQRLEHLEVLRCAARRHDRLRLLLRYGFLPLRRHWESSRRVAANVSTWHRLRVLHGSWLGWLRFVHEMRAERQQLEHRRLAFAARHRARALQRWGFTALRSLRLQTQHATLAARQHSQQQLRCRVWRRWQRFVAHQRALEQEQVRRIADQLCAQQLQRAWIRWRAAAAELRAQRERQEEKARLWRKVRGWLDEE